MEKKVKLAAIALALALLLLAWAPWMDEQEVHDRVLREKAQKDGTIDRQTGVLVCDYKVGWLPFGRWVGSCEGAYFVTFYGQILS